jgi:hypothetical protein
LIINIREKIKNYDQKTLDLLDNDLNKKPFIIVDNLMGIYCGEKFSANEVEEAIIEFNLRLVKGFQTRLPKKEEIDSKGKSFWLEEDEPSNDLKGLFLVMNTK